MNFLMQSKLDESEWKMIEKPITNKKEIQILKMINEGFHNEDIQISNNIFINDYLKVDTIYDDYIYQNLFQPIIVKMNTNNILKLTVKYIYTENEYKQKKGKNKKLPKDVTIKLNNSIQKINKNEKSNILEFKLLEYIKCICKFIKKEVNNKKLDTSCFLGKKISVSFYNINFILQNHGQRIQKNIKSILHNICETFNPYMNYNSILKSASHIFEANEIHDTSYYTLHPHQKHIYNIFKNHNESKLIMYCAPTSSGKTLTPIGLSNSYRVLFLCASKHIGLNLAKSAFSVGKKIGFAFGCNDTSQIRLNYNTINSWIQEKNGRTRPDHSDGKNVEIMISDLKSYEYAMLYMKAFNKLENIIMFWDEPTIGLDVETSPMHAIVKHNWKINKIPNVVLSCATLPKQHQIQGIIIKHEERFGPNIYFEYIDVHDQNTNLMIYDTEGNVVMPHNQFDNLKDLHEFLIYQNKKYFKFYNCQECANFILFYNTNYDDTYIVRKFKSFDDITIYNIKYLYYTLLLEIDSQTTYQNMIETYNENKEKTNLYIKPELTTKSAHTLGNGPTLYMTNEIDKVCKYLLHISEIPDKLIESLSHKIHKNEEIAGLLNEKRKDYEDKTEKYKDSTKKMENLNFPKDVLDLRAEIQRLEDSLYSLQIDAIYKPNTRDHFNKWTSKLDIDQKFCYETFKPFVSSLNDHTIQQIMSMTTISTKFKILALLGIGVFTESSVNCENTMAQESLKEKESGAYNSIMKSAASSKSLYLLLANSDYIYGTNYQFSHCYLGKDMDNLSQEKIIQCIGRVGRQEKNQHYSFRFRSNQQIKSLYSISKFNIEADNMNRLFI